MIAAIDGRAGLPTDKPMALQAPARGPQFSHVLETVHQDTPKAPPPPSRPAATQETQGRAVAKRQVPDTAPDQDIQNPPAAHSRKSADEDVSADRRPEKSSAAAADEPQRQETRHDADASNAVTPDASTVRMPAQPQPMTAQQIAGVQPQDGQVLTLPQGKPTLAQGYAQSAQVGSTLQAQLGRAAYNLSPHGVGEPVQPTYAAPASAGALAALQNADPEQQGAQASLHVVSVQEIVQLSNSARASMIAGQETGVKTAADTGESHRETARQDPNSAQARNQLLAQIGGAASAAPVQPSGTAANAGQGDAGSLGAQAQASTLPKELKPASATAQAASPVTDPSSAAGAVAGAATLGAAHHTQAAQPVPDGGQKLDPAMMNKVMQESRWLIRSGHSEVTFKLQPENLGEVKLKVVHKDGDLTVQMTVDSLATKHLLDASLKDLRQQLQQENLAQGNLLLNVDVRQGADSGGFSGFARRAADEGGVKAVGTAPAEEVPAAGHAHPAAWGNSNISIYA